MSYGLPAGTSIYYGAPGFPAWVYRLGEAFGLKASTYPGHQETDRIEAGFARNPQRLNRAIDWTGPVDAMQRFAEYCLSIRGSLEQVIWQNPNTGRRVGVAGGQDVSTTGYYGADYGGHQDHVHTRQSKPIPLPKEAAVSNRPAFNEFPVWSKNNSSRSAKVDAFFLHTQEGGGGDAAAENLAKWFQNANEVSYHYTISQAADGGVTVVDCVDTDRASWSVLSANSRSINLCFAGSRSSWSRADWLKQAKAIDVAAYLAVKDAKKYGFPANVIAPPYSGRLPGISDHRYVTKVLGDGTHTDVGDGFPWDVFAAAVAKYAGGAPSALPPPAPPAKKPVIVGPADDQLTMRWNMLGGKTIVEALAEVRDKLCGTNDKDKPGVVVS
ncbi:N-acetylmuramoyl-L-alanine amidase [Mycobacterium sp. TY815]|uniref:N-acetylmuramoyl-L-alanine amidase n=1 Tax=Mycobacterium sp. TY815 TaxID=3050581 RepID=UPI0027415DBD|nr:N-acetylmuramoyl-L-alanine amidase [Mycobacterium sp. TY815]MDP7706789.1 N-acetylmuramoyl-L-alanine amidase [Mycobacterium sp. TY815]